MKNINDSDLFDDHFLMEKLTKPGDPLQKLNEFIDWTGTAPGEWKQKPHKLAQKDVDARWTKKNNTVFYGYKNHVKADTKTKLIEEYTVTDASVHDSQAMEQLLTGKDEGQPLYADSAYTGEDQETVYKKKKVIN